MNRERAKELLPIIQAYAEGKTIQYTSRSIDNEWLDCPDPQFSHYLEWRIKPEAREFWVEIDPYYPFRGVTEQKVTGFGFLHEDEALPLPTLDRIVIKVQEVIE